MRKVNAMRKIEVLLVGFGNIGRLIGKYVGEHGGVVCAIVDSDPSLWGEKAFGATVGGDLAAALKESAPDIAVVSVGSRLLDVLTLIETCLLHGVNTITTSEEALYPYGTDPATAAALDALARANRCTLTASGFQDCFWVHSVTAFAASVSRIDRISGKLRYDIDEYGAALAADHGVGLTVAEFEERMNGPAAYSYIENSVELLAERLGWGAVSMIRRSTPYVYHEDLYSVALGETIPKGRVVGSSTVVITETACGGAIEAECVGKIYTAGDHDLCRWTLTGEPSLTFEACSPKTPEHTAAAIVNRIPQVIREKPGYVTIDKRPPAEYLTFPMFLYL